MFDRITRNPEILNGQPCIRNLRLSVKRVLEILALYGDRKELYLVTPKTVDNLYIKIAYYQQLKTLAPQIS